MTEKIGIIKNPLTVIAIFAGIAEVSGTVVLPFISENNQLTFIYFLLFFPSVLVALFFVTLNFNNKALYAPSDFNNEENYIKIFKYDISRQEQVEIKVSQEELLKILNRNVSELKTHYDLKIQKIEKELKAPKDLNPTDTFQNIIGDEDRDDYIKEYVEGEEEYDEINIEEGLVTINNLPNAKKLSRNLQARGYLTEIYQEEEYSNDLRGNKSIWLGYKVPFKEAKEIILLSKKNFPHLTYIDYSNNKSNPPYYIHHQTFIGGSTHTAKDRGVKALSAKDWEKIHSIDDSVQFVEFIKTFQ